MMGHSALKRSYTTKESFIPACYRETFGFRSLRRLVLKLRLILKYGHFRNKRLKARVGFNLMLIMYILQERKCLLLVQYLFKRLQTFMVCILILNVTFDDVREFFHLVKIPILIVLQRLS